MSQQFKEQGGAATMDPSPFRRWVTSKIMTAMSSETRQQKQRQKAETKRLKAREPHVVEYFHQLEDGYSHLAAQLLRAFAKRYQVNIKCHMVSGPVGDNSPEPDLLLRLSRYDSSQVAAHYGLSFPEHKAALPRELIDRAGAILASLGDQAFIENVSTVGHAMWEGDSKKLVELADSLGLVTSAEVQYAVIKGNTRRTELKHYSGAMFYYGGEWYWGVDRLYHLEQRLAELGLDTAPDQPPLAPRPSIDAGPLQDDGRLTLEIYPSLRSPYTAVIFNKTVVLANEVGIKLKVRPVLPMVMRGVPATRDKGMYILFDAGREARGIGVQFGPCADPIGEPARRAYSLFPWAEEKGRSIEFFSAFLNCAWVDAINTNSDKGMKKVVERAGLDWSEAKSVIGQSGWQEMLESNRLAMYEMGIWGVPSYRLLDENNQSLLEMWGQDRLWLVSRVIQQQLATRK